MIYTRRTAQELALPGWLETDVAWFVWVFPCHFVLSWWNWYVARNRYDTRTTTPVAEASWCTYIHVQYVLTYRRRALWHVLHVYAFPCGLEFQLLIGGSFSAFYCWLRSGSRYNTIQYRPISLCLFWEIHCCSDRMFQPCENQVFQVRLVAYGVRISLRWSPLIESSRAM